MNPLSIHPIQYLNTTKNVFNWSNCPIIISSWNYKPTNVRQIALERQSGHLKLEGPVALNFLWVQRIRTKEGLEPPLKSKNVRIVERSSKNSH